MNARIPDLNEFNYVRKAHKVKIYGNEYEMPVRTAAFCDKQDEIDREMMDGKIKNTSDFMAIIRKGIDLFIGSGETEKIFPVENESEIDVDEMTACYNFLKYESLANLREHTQKYAPRNIIRR